jgi:hypothetical protein
VKVCILALLIERIAEISCGEPWSRIRRKLEGLEFSELITPGYRFFRKNEIPFKTRSMLNILGVSMSKLVVGLEKRQKTSLKS